MSQEYTEQTPAAAEASGPEQKGPADANAEPRDEIHQPYSPHFAPILFRWCCKNCTNMNGINLNREILEWDAAASAVLARNRRRREQYLMMKASHKQINRQLQQHDMQYNADGGTDSYPPPPPPPVSDPLPPPPPFPALTDASDRELCAECGAARISTEELLRLTLGPEAAAAVAAYGVDLNDVLKHNPDKGEVGQGIDGPDDIGKGVVAPCSGVVDPRGSTAHAPPAADAVFDADRDAEDIPPSSAAAVSKPLPAIPLQSASSLDPVIAGSTLASFRRLIGAEPMPRHTSSILEAPAQSAASAPADWNSFAHSVVGMLPVARSVTGIGFDPRMMLHREIPSERLLHKDLPPVPSPEHPERPDRLKAIMQHLVAVGLYQRCVAVNSREATQAELATMHTAMHCQTITELESPDAEPLLGDTFACVESPLAARLAVGTLLNVTEAVCHGHITNGIAVVRPPGHHAEADRAMGFCLYNNAAVAAHVAKTQWGAKRVLVMDWDVHHGNGTQHLLDHDPDIMYMSIHRYDNGTFFPGTGAADEVGLGAARGTTVNIPWPCGGMGDAEYMAAFSDVVMPIAHQFSPDLVIISAGFDAADGDPLGGCRVTPAGYAHMTAMLSSLAHGKVVLALEGGYNLTCISRSMEACVRVMLGENPPVLKEDPDSMSVSDTGLDWMMAGQLMDSDDDEDMRDGRSDAGSGAGSAVSGEKQPHTTAAAATTAATVAGSARPTNAGMDDGEEGPAPESTPASQDGSEGPAGGYTSDGVDDHVMAEVPSAPAAATASAPDVPATITALATDASKGPVTPDSPVHDRFPAATNGTQSAAATETQPPSSQPSEHATTAPTQATKAVDAILPSTAGPASAPSSSSGSSAASDSSSNSSVVSSEASAHLDRERQYHRILAARQRQQHRHAERHAASDSVIPCFPAPRAEAARTIAQVMIIQSPFWSCMRMKVGALAQIASMYPSMGQALRRIVQSTPGPSRDFRIGSEMVGQAHFASGASSPSSSQVSDSDATTPRRARSHASRTTGGGEDGDESMLGGSPDTRGSVLSRTAAPQPAATNGISSGGTAAHEGSSLGQPTALQSSTPALAPSSAVAEMVTGLPQGHIAGLAAVTGASASSTLYPQDLHERPPRRMSVGGRPPPTAAPSLVSDATAVAGGTTSREYGEPVGSGGGGPVDLSFMQPTASAPPAFAPPGPASMQEQGMPASLHAQSSSSDPFLQASSMLLPPNVPGHNDSSASTTGLTLTPAPPMFRDSFPPWSVAGTRGSSEANSHQIHASTTSPSDSLQLVGVPGATASFGYPDLNSPGHRFSPSLLSPHTARDASAPGLTPTLPHLPDVEAHRTVSSDRSTPLGSAESSLRFAWAGAACAVSQAGASAMTGVSTVCASVRGDTTVGDSSVNSSAADLGGKEDLVLLPADSAMKPAAGIDSSAPPPLASSASPATKRAAAELAAADSQAKKTEAIVGGVELHIHCR